jgi:radical SAM protein with 4Fe4S-binding SPASM domain
MFDIGGRIKDGLFGLRKKYIDRDTPRRVPAAVQIEASSKCNLRCPECAHSRDGEPGQHLTAIDFNKILVRLPFSIKRVMLSGIGEPLLNPHYFSLVDALAERQIRCRFITNGTLLTQQMCEAIIRRPNIEYVVISCDGVEKTTFENFRAGANFETWTEFIRHFAIRAKQERPDLRIGMNTVITRQNLLQLREMVHMAADLGFQNIHFLDPIPVDDIAAGNVPSKDELARINFKDLHKSGRLSGLKVTWSIRRDKVYFRLIPRCLQPWEDVFVRANGDMLPCPANFSTKKLAVMGNIFLDDFNKIWNGSRFREYRRTCLTGTNPLCRVCPFY